MTDVRSNSIGLLLVGSMWGVASSKLSDLDVLRSTVVEGACVAGLHIRRIEHEVFRSDLGEGHVGFTIVAILSESHIVFHTYPEQERIEIDIFTCSTADPLSAYQYFVKYLSPSIERHLLIRRAHEFEISEINSPSPKA